MIGVPCFVGIGHRLILGPYLVLLWHSGMHIQISLSFEVPELDGKDNALIRIEFI